MDGAQEIIQILFDQNYSLVYGGGAKGLMGTIADHMIKLGGDITGIIPSFMKSVEWDHKGVRNMIVVNDMHERKRFFLEMSDVVMALPGGCGTLEELMEVITWKRLDLYKGPIIIFNQDGYYDGLLAQLQRCVDDECMSEIHSKIWTVIDHPDQLIPAINNATSWETYSIADASV